MVYIGIAVSNHTIREILKVLAVVLTSGLDISDYRQDD